nr:acyltransferase [uncultured bacterium]
MVGRVTTFGRRIASIGGLFVLAVSLLVLLPIWLPVSTVADLVRGRVRLPFARLLLFALGWAWLELACVLIAFGLWLGGRSKNHEVHYRLQTWWAANVLGLLRAATGIRVIAENVDELRPGPAVLLCRHASLADSLFSAWMTTSLADMHPRYVLRRALLTDPCVDIVGNRLPNYFLDRDEPDSQVELDALTRLSTGMGDQDIAVIFPEATRARSAALLAGSPQADIVVGWHVGVDGLDTFGGILRHLAHKPTPVRFRARRIPRALVPDGPAFAEWLDAVWLQAGLDGVE